MNVFANDMNRVIPKISEQAMNILKQYDWNGNVRELQNIVQRLLLLGEKNIVGKHVNTALGLAVAPDSASYLQVQKLLTENKIIPWREMEKKVRREYFEYVREFTSSDAEAARKLGLAPPNYHRMCKELGLK